MLRKLEASLNNYPYCVCWEWERCLEIMCFSSSVCVWPSMKSVYVTGLHLHTRTEITFQISYVGFLCADCIW